MRVPMACELRQLFSQVDLVHRGSPIRVRRRATLDPLSGRAGLARSEAD